MKNQWNPNEPRKRNATRGWLVTLLMATTTVAMAPSGAADCDNYGMITSVGHYECQVQYCDQGTGAGAGAGAGGPGSNDASAGASAGTECKQEGSSGHDWLWGQGALPP